MPTARRARFEGRQSVHDDVLRAAVASDAAIQRVSNDLQAFERELVGVEIALQNVDVGRQVSVTV